MDFSNMFRLPAIVIGIMLAVAFAVGWQSADNRVDVKIYKSKETGNYIYCMTGELQGNDHEYMGEGKIEKDKAVHC